MTGSELQSTGEAMSEEEYLTLSEQAGNLCAITSIKADTLGENNLADCTGFENNELIGELGGNSFYLSNDNLSPESPQRRGRRRPAGHEGLPARTGFQSGAVHPH